MLQHLFSVTVLAQQHQAELRGQADRWRLAHSARADRRSHRRAVRRWWRAATPSQA